MIFPKTMNASCQRRYNLCTLVRQKLKLRYTLASYFLRVDRNRFARSRLLMSINHLHCIWAHLRPIINLEKTLVANLKIIHVFSDGLLSIDKKNNFLLISNFSAEFHVNVTWSFFESGHAKGLPM